MIILDTSEKFEEYCLSPSAFPLHIHNWGSEFPEFFSLDIPYLFIQQECDPQKDIWEITLWAPNLKATQVRTYQNYLKIWNNKSAHHQNYYDGAYLLEGELVKVIEGKRYPLVPGQFLLMNQNILHMEEPHTRYKVLFFLISESFLEEMLSILESIQISEQTQQSLDLVRGMAFNAKKEQHYYAKEFLSFQPLQTDLIRHLISEILKELSVQEPGYGQIVRGLLCRTLSQLLLPENYTLSKHILDGKNDDRIFTKISQLLEQSNGNISRKALSEELNYNHDYLNSIVKKHTGMSLKKYAQRFQLKSAAHMLSETNLPIADIIHRAGFSNRTYFYRVFAKKYECTPKEYRDQHQQA